VSGLIPLTGRELKKWYRNPVFFITGLLQPFFWIVLFGSAFDFTRFDASASQYVLGGAANYITYIVGGVLTTSALFTGMFAGTNIIFDRRLGPMGRFLSSPIRRSSIVLSKVLSTTVRIMPQSVILVVAALLIPNGLKFQHGLSVPGLFVIIAAIILVSIIFSSIFSAIATRMTNMNSIFGIVNMINLPLLFVSYAMFSPEMMAPWISNIAKYNPVSWSAEAMRMVIINGSPSTSQWGQIGMWLGALAILAVGMVVFTAYLAEKEIRD
jgi:ABC-type multidrug transport system, permease component